MINFHLANHMSVDADKWGDGFIYLNMWMSVPMEIGIGLWLCTFFTLLFCLCRVSPTMIFWTIGTQPLTSIFVLGGKKNMCISISFARLECLGWTFDHGIDDTSTDPTRKTLWQDRERELGQDGWTDSTYDRGLDRDQSRQVVLLVCRQLKKENVVRTGGEPISCDF